MLQLKSHSVKSLTKSVREITQSHTQATVLHMKEFIWKCPFWNTFAFQMSSVNTPVKISIGSVTYYFTCTYKNDS